ncbi:hypothetical protein LTR20_010730 [Exophiala xenobiotica]|nr:hypothetical protein LTS13_006566 [Exophiala xenobiotica]KAK5401064.1 hypothetical protein LTR79_001583 [Exophiala xenobiotica]KAK5408993.1 hypothetical protein LTR90_009116 [Exophiala xenobiotica]KAK5453183.1 hypothetical protein LTR20_010730 [Exophiala xenobiotica]KAK5488834.1 hypothetical protein LTR26_004150 [Exophiala xenobiotica]
MRLARIVVLTLLSCILSLAAGRHDGSNRQKRQDTTDATFPTLTTDSPSSPTEAISTESSSPTSAASSQPSTTHSTSPSSATEHSSTTQSAKTTYPGTPTNPTASASVQDSNELPLEPRITPALGIAGVFLIFLGAVYALIGVKSRGIQIFLSCGFLASIATTALVGYILDPPVSDAVQGGFFVAIVMTGTVFGGGALIFKDITEGFGCLLGGFCFSMWLLTLQPGGLVTSSGGKGAFIGVFCLAAWALSWTKYTRPYALIGSTALGGATAFVLGLDCFTRAGMKEYWFYLWNLNDNLFPLHTVTYPLTKGIKVEIAVIVIGTIIGLLSQITLWKVIRSKQITEADMQQENDQQKEAVEAALGRQLERQNEREKAVWERQYGDRVRSMRNTLLWQNAHSDKRYSTVSVVAVQQSTPSVSTGDVEMNDFGLQRVQSGHGSKSKRQSSVTVDVIPEAEEDNTNVASTERQRALLALERGKSSDDLKSSGDLSRSTSTLNPVIEDDDGESGISQPDSGVELPKPKRRSTRQSISGLTKRLTPGYTSIASQSQERLVEVGRPHSRASSAAATVGGDNEELNVGLLHGENEGKTLETPDIVISPALSEGGDPSEVMFDTRKKSGAYHLGYFETTDSEAHLDMPSSASATASSGDFGENIKILDQGEGRSEMEPSKSRAAQSQGSGATASSTESLTRTALAQVPSQISNVVLSYRTNEWAKYLTSAEAPIYDEPETIEGVDKELPTHVAPATLAASGEASAQRLPTGLVTPSVRASNAGVGIASQLTATPRSFSDPERRRSAMKPPSRSPSMQSYKLSSNKGGRGSYSPSVATSLAITPIVENVPAQFAAPRSAGRRASAGSPYMMPTRRPSATSVGSGGSRPYSAHGPATQYGSVYDITQSGRPASQQYHRSGSGTSMRMDSNELQQPQHNPRQEAAKRESLLADWRVSQQQRASHDSLEATAAETGRARMKAELDNRRRMEEFQRHEQQRRQYAMDQVMRRPEMQDLHREAIRKMQAGANKKLRSSTG